MIKKNAEKYTEQIARLIANNTEGVCIQFAKDIDFYGDFECKTCPLHNKCNNAEQIAAWLQEEARNETETS